ncbi:MAG: hypothetical protein ABW179_05485 [Methylobacterium sp.]
MKPVPFLAALVPAVGCLVSIAALRHDLVWYEGTALFYGVVALAEGGYLAAAFLGDRTDRGTAQERRAKTGAGE